jgi:hypothetical protein
MTVASAALHNPTEAEEVAQHCAKCGAAKAEFDLFCNNCHSPLLRRFGMVLSFEILLFLAAAVVIALVRQERLPVWLARAPGVFIFQAVGFYLLRLSLRQPRFLFILALYLVFIIIFFAGFGSRSMLLQAAPLYVGLGTFILWFRRRESQPRHVSIQTFWIAVLITVVGIGQFLKLTTQTATHPDPMIAPLEKIFILYTPWLMLAGLAITFGIQSALRVSQRGIVVGKYLQGARILPGPRGSRSVLMLPLIAATRTLIAFYNAMIGVLALFIRAFVFILKFAQAYVIGLASEFLQMFRQVGRFVGVCITRVVLPLFLTAYLAQLTIQSDILIPAYLFGPTWHGAMMVTLQAALISLALFACITCFARVSPPQFLETYSRDGAVIAGYGLPLLLLCTLALHAAGMATHKYLQFDLPYAVGPFGWVTVGLLGLAMLILLQRRIFSRGKSAPA